MLILDFRQLSSSMMEILVVYEIFDFAQNCQFWTKIRKNETFKSSVLLKNRKKRLLLVNVLTPFQCFKFADFLC